LFVKNIFLEENMSSSSVLGQYIVVAIAFFIASMTFFQILNMFVNYVLAPIPNMFNVTTPASYPYPFNTTSAVVNALRDWSFQVLTSTTGALMILIIGMVKDAMETRWRE
jgi:hypothetical protein